MAKLISPATTIVLKPQTRETPASNWIETIVGIEFHVQEEKLYLELPPKEVSIKIEEFEAFIHKFREYIADLPIAPNSIITTVKTCYFLPLEARFSIESSSGYYMSEKRDMGKLAIGFNMSLTPIDISYGGIGCDFSIEISEFLGFLDELEQEVNAL